MEQQAVASGLGLQPIFYVVPVDIRASYRDGRRLADHAVPQIRVDLIVRAFGKRSVGRLLGFVMAVFPLDLDRVEVCSLRVPAAIKLVISQPLPAAKFVYPD